MNAIKQAELAAYLFVIDVLLLVIVAGVLVKAVWG